MQTQRYLYLHNPPILYVKILQYVPKHICYTCVPVSEICLVLLGSFCQRFQGFLIFHFLAPTPSAFGGLSILICHTLSCISDVKELAITKLVLHI